MKSAQLTMGLLGIGLLLAPLRVARAGQGGNEASTPVLRELDRETRALYQNVEPSIVRVQLPTSRPAQEDLVSKWNNVLSPEMKIRLQQEQQDVQPNGMPRVQILPDTRPDAVEASLALGNSGGEAPPVMPNAVGIVLDKEGRVFLPVWVDGDSLKGKTIPVVLGNGVESQARFIGSDRQTNVTILQVDGLEVPQVTLNPNRPDDGGLVMVFAVRRTMTRLSVWTSGLMENGVVVNVDGSIAGFARQGEFLNVATCLPVVEQLEKFGHVTRAFLGIKVNSVLPDDPERVQNPALGTTPGIRIAEVLPDSVADHAGFREGDLILSLGGKTVDDPATFGATIAAMSGKQELTILRGERKIEVSVVLEPPKN